MPNRIIKDSIRTSKSVNQLTDFQFRLWVYLITYVDDYGRGSADPELLKGFVFPRRKNVTESTIEKELAALATSGLIDLYKVDGESYFCFPKWSDHQRVQTKKSKYPAPEKSGENFIPQKSTVSHRDSPPESNPIQSNPNTESESEYNPPQSPPRGEEGKKKPRFVKPTVEEIKAYCLERNNSVDAEAFYAFYESKGWYVGRNPMKNWKAAVITWEKSNKNRAPATEGTSNPFLDMLRDMEMQEAKEGPIYAEFTEASV